MTYNLRWGVHQMHPHHDSFEAGLDALLVARAGLIHSGDQPWYNVFFSQ